METWPRNVPAELADTVTGRCGSLGELRAPHRVGGPACPGQGFAELELEDEVELGCGTRAAARSSRLTAAP